MAANLDYDTDNRIIYVTTAPTGGELTLDVKQNIYSDMKKDWQETPALSKFKFPLAEPVGGNLTKPPDRISPFYFTKYGWTMRPYEGDHTLYLENGYLLVDGGGDPWNTTIGAYTVNVRDTVPADAFAVAGSGAATPAAIAAAVWAYALNSSRTAGEELEYVTQQVENVPGDVWDEVLTGATHNIPASAGRRLRQLGDVVSGVVVADSGNTAIQFVTDLTEARDDFYNDQLVRFTTGNLLGYAAPILDYDGTNKIIIVDEAMVDIPDDSIEFDILPTHVHPISQIVDGLWDELTAGHVTSGSFAELLVVIGKLTGNKVTKSGDVITIYENDEATPWRQYNLASGGRVEV